MKKNAALSWVIGISVYILAITFLLKIMGKVSVGKYNRQWVNIDTWEKALLWAVLSLPIVGLSAYVAVRAIKKNEQRAWRVCPKCERSQFPEIKLCPDCSVETVLLSGFYRK